MIDRKRVLILCTGNSARSQMAEGLLRHDAGDRFEVASAGVEPSRVRPEAIEAMNHIGIDISSHRSKSVDEFAGQEFDYVITVCDNANEHCPVFPGNTKRIHTGALTIRSQPKATMKQGVMCFGACGTRYATDYASLPLPLRNRNDLLKCHALIRLFKGVQAMLLVGPVNPKRFVLESLFAGNDYNFLRIHQSLQGAPPMALVQSFGLLRIVGNCWIARSMLTQYDPSNLSRPRPAHLRRRHALFVGRTRGASGYLAAMALFGLAPAVMKPTALTLNILVVTIATVKFHRAGCFRGGCCCRSPPRQYPSPHRRLHYAARPLLSGAVIGLLSA
jgi:arsenate reductase